MSRLEDQQYGIRQCLRRPLRARGDTGCSCADSESAFEVRHAVYDRASFTMLAAGLFRRPAAAREESTHVCGGSMRVDTPNRMESALW